MTSDIIQMVVGGLLTGGIYSLAAFGLAVTFGVLGVLNVAHGEFLMLGAWAAWFLFTRWGVAPPVAALLTIPAFVVLGLGYHFLLLRPIAAWTPTRRLTAAVLVTLGTALIIEDLAGLFWERPLAGLPWSLPGVEWRGVIIPGVRVLILAGMVLVATTLQWGLKKTTFGLSLRAATQCREGALLAGVRVGRVAALTFGLGTAAAALAGIAYATLFAASPVMGLPLTVKLLGVVVLGGLGRLIGVVLGGLGLGLAEAFTGYYLGPQWSPALAYGLLIAVLLLRPRISVDGRR